MLLKSLGLGVFVVKRAFNPVPSEWTSTLRVRYAETDAMGIAHHASYIVWLEWGRTELLRAYGMPYRELEARGTLIVLSDLHVRYLAAARYDDEMRIHTQIGELRSRQISFDYRITLAETETTLVQARTTHVALDQVTRKPMRFPTDLLALLRA